MYVISYSSVFFSRRISYHVKSVIISVAYVYRAITEALATMYRTESPVQAEFI